MALPSRRAVWIPVLVAAVACAPACGGDDPAGSGGGDVAGAGGGGDGGADACGGGELRGGDGVCRAVGVQRCDPSLLDAEGFCSPAMAACPGGSIPNLAAGCVAVGIPSCAPEFLGGDGHCHVTSAACPAGTFAVPQRGCVSVDGPDGCGTGTWGAIADDPGNLYVDGSAPSGGDGSRDSPVQTIAGALQLAATGRRVVVAAGRYTEALTVSRAVEIVGRCASQVTIDGTSGDPDAPTVILGLSGALTIRGLTLSGDGVGVLVSDAGLTVDHVVIDGCLGVGVVAINSPAEITSSIIRGTRSQDLSFGRAIDAELGAVVIVTDTAIVGNREEAVWASGAGTHVSLTDVLVEGTLPEEATDLGGEGVKIAQGAEATLSAVAIVGNQFAGIHVFDAQSHVHADQVVIEGTLPEVANGHYGVGAQAWQGGSLELVRSALLGNRVVGVVADGLTSPVTIDRTLIADMEGDQTAHFGRAVNARGGVAVTILDSAFVRARETAVVAIGAGTSIVAHGLLVEDTQPDVDDEFGVGIMVDSGVVDLDGVTVRGGRVGGFIALQGTTGTVTESSFLGVASGNFHYVNPTVPVTDVGDGICVSDGSTLTITSVRVDGCARAGLLFDDSGGAIVTSAATNGQYGLVLDGDQTPSVDAALAIDQNQTPSIDDASLPVTAAPADVPM